MPILLRARKILVDPRQNDHVYAQFCKRIGTYNYSIIIEEKVIRDLSRKLKDRLIKITQR